MKKRKDTTKIANIFQMYSNPLFNLNNVEIDRLFQNARLGNDIKLQICYFEMEKSAPIFSICINKRIAGVLNRKWDIIPIDESEEAKNQADIVKKMFVKSDLKNEDGLTEALRHLVLSSFRGRAAVKPFITDEGLIFKKLENWNYLNYNGKNYWSIESQPVITYNNNELDLPEIPKDEICYIVDDKPLDWCGLTIYLRQLIGEEQWARCVEKFGIPQVLLTTPEGTPEQDLEKWNYRSQAIYEGASGVLPFGSVPHILNEARGQDPFTSFVTHQMEMFTLLAIGGTVDTLGGTQGSSGTGMGSSTSDNQISQFENLVNFDCKRIANALQVAINKCVKSFDKTGEVKCRFEFIEKEKISPEQYLNLARMCRDIGMSIDINKLKEMTGLQFINEEEKDLWTPERLQNQKDQVTNE